MSDGVPAIKLLHGQPLTDSSRHMELKYFFSRIVLKRNRWKTKCLEGGRNAADVFTKPAKEYIYKRLRKYLVVSSRKRKEKKGRRY
eukprot:snap_masked-scaffold_11-processed-gene-8.14-mRNA-1 protein AED:1.00 eAED:1.00 QI:0/-1/0/0/-1/1/1/0/85